MNLRRQEPSRLLSVPPSENDGVGHAPYLLAEGKAKADPNKEPDWDEAIKKLGMLVQFYPESPQAKEGGDTLKRILANKAALEGIKKKNILNDSEWKRTASKYDPCSRCHQR